MQDHHVPLSKCPTCLRDTNGAMNAEVDNNDPPSPGDVIACLYCGAFSVFDDDLQARVPTDDELVKILRDPRARVAQEAIRAVHREAASE